MSDATKTTGAPSTPESPHQNQPVRTAGATLEDAQAAVVMVHGRGATAESILALAREFAFPDDVCYLAPQAAGRSWYPKSFLAPLAENEPGLSSGLRAIGDAARRATEAGLPAEHTLLLGFSQGACLVSEFAARAPARYGGLALLSGGLIGSGQKAGAEPPEDKHFDYEGDFDGTPAFFGCSDQDPHIPHPAGARAPLRRGLPRARGRRRRAHLRRDGAHRQRGRADIRAGAPADTHSGVSIRTVVPRPLSQPLLLP